MKIENASQILSYQTSIAQLFVEWKWSEMTMSIISLMLHDIGVGFRLHSSECSDDSTYTRMTKHSIRSEALEYGIENKKLHY